jgi:hypothetical protein
MVDAFCPSLRAQRGNPDFGAAGLLRFARNDEVWSASVIRPMVNPDPKSLRPLRPSAISARNKKVWVRAKIAENAEKRRGLCSFRVPELVEGLRFSALDAARQGFDKLSHTGQEALSR